MASDRLQTLLAWKQQVEDTAARALGEATGARLRAETEQAALAQACERARAVLLAHRGNLTDRAERAADAATRQRFTTRLAAEAEAQVRRAEAHRQDVLGPARQAEDEARNRHLVARQDREAVEAHRDKERAAESRRADQKQQAEQDDRPPPRNRN